MGRKKKKKMRLRQYQLVRRMNRANRRLGFEQHPHKYTAHCYRFCGCYVNMTALLCELDVLP
jgi:hypothetical protein